MLKETQIAFIGSGIMAEAMVKGLVGQGLMPAQNINASGPRPERGAELAERYGIQVTEDNVAAAKGRDIVVVSIKPQFLDEVLEELCCGAIKPKALVLSIVAGTTIGRIAKGINHQAIVRVMPNTPAQVGLGMSVWTATPETDEAQREQARTILAALGEELYMEHEDYLDMATALSGTGPAYVFLVMEALIDAGVHMGSHDESRSNWSCRRCVDLLSLHERRSDTRLSCGTWLPRQEEPRPRHCTNWKRAACGQ